MSSTLNIQAADHPIKSVTVFKSSKAEVVRTFSLHLKKGQNKIEIRGLPSTIDTHSVRVSGLGDARLFDIVCTIAPSKTAGRAFAFDPDSPSEVVRALHVKRAALESEKVVREQEAQLLLQYAQTLNGEHVTPVQMGQFLESYVEQGRKNTQARTELGEKIIQIDREIEEERGKTALKKGTALGQVDIVIVADEDSSVELKLTYIVSNAQWKPTYELHATTMGGKPSSSVALHYRARVTQSTGEDWSNTSLTLSTVASDTVVKRIPQLRPIRIQPRQVQVQSQFPKNVNNNVNKGGLFGNTSNNVFSNNANVKPSTFGPPQQRQQQFPRPHGLFGGGGPPNAALTGFAAFGAQQQHPAPAFGQTGLFGALPAIQPAEVVVDPHLMQSYSTETAHTEAVPLAEEDDDFEAVDGPAAITEPTTIVSETPMAISFSVHGDSTIPTDGVDHQVSVAVLPFQAKISYIAIPRIDPRCEVENSSEYRLLPGPVTVILDDSYVSKTSINDINTGDNFQCTLGDDASTKVTYLRSAKTVKSTGGAFSEVTNTTTYTTKISIHNKHQFALTDLIVRDVIPTCEDKRAKVVLRKPMALADAKDGECVDVAGNGNEGLKVGWETLVDGKGGEKEGKFEWRWKVGNGAKVVLEAEWEVKVPGELPWMEVSPYFSGSTAL